MTPPLLIEQGGLIKLPSLVAPLGKRFALIADSRILSLYKDTLIELFSKAALPLHLLSFPSGEKYKTREMKQQLEDELLSLGLGRDVCLIAFGGGVTTDLVGFVAATYLRGVPLVLCPTSFLAMVDACLGGKVGVNTPHGKNLIGTFFPPRHILIDPLLLQTLPEEEWVNGFVETIKHALIADSSLFTYLEEHPEPLIRQDSTSLTALLQRSLSIKQSIVEQDPEEKGIRRLLNLGHTVGHAIEQLTHYTVTHGRAVAIGIIVESYLSFLCGHLPEASFKRIEALLTKHLIPVSFSLEELSFAMRLDKKALLNRPRFVLLKEIGMPCPFEGAYCDFVDDSLIQQALTYLFDVLYAPRSQP